MHVSAPSDDLLLDIFDLFQTETFHFVGKKPLQESYCEVVLLPIHEQLEYTSFDVFRNEH